MKIRVDYPGYWAHGNVYEATRIWPREWEIELFEFEHDGAKHAIPVTHAKVVK